MKFERREKVVIPSGDNSRASTGRPMPREAGVGRVSVIMPASAHRSSALNQPITRALHEQGKAAVIDTMDDKVREVAHSAYIARAPRPVQRPQRLLPE
jgi:hypothetical protein